MLLVESSKYPFCRITFWKLSWNWIYNFAKTIEAVDDELDKIDSEGTFRSDDEVGWFYQSMYSILKRLYEYRILIKPGETTAGEATDEEPNIFYAGDRELNRRIERRKRLFKSKLNKYSLEFLEKEVIDVSY